MQEPLEQYLELFERYRQVVEELIEWTVDLTQIRLYAADILVKTDFLTVVRFLASPFISEDDLKILAETTLSPKGLTDDGSAGAQRVVDVVMLGLDRNRFPWVGENRTPTDIERLTAVISTAALIATQRVQTMRRNSSKDEQEEMVASYLVSQGFTQVATRAVNSLADLPAPGEFCREAMFGTRKADLVVRAWDGRAMPIECKVSNSSTNSVKRLNNDAAVKAVVWLQEFGQLTAIPAALLAGVFKVGNLKSAQNQGLTIFWEHGLDALGTFLEATKKP
uniref:Restriction nuclease n=2 Tax=Nocardiaceae TaxID=85025 RepID=A2A145_RHORH|nr:restriction nuclease [Rhodococcus rhodochrous]